MTIDNDHKKHFVICAIATLAGFGYMATFFAFWPSFWSSFLLPMGLGFGKEYGDSQASGNKWDWTDIGADIAGTVVAMAFILLLKFIASLISD